MAKIKFADNIWTATIANDFTTDNVARVAKASAVWLLNKTKEASIVIGYDARFGGKLFAEATAKVFALMGVKVYISPGMISAAIISLGIIKKNATMGVLISANNEHPKYNGYILFGGNGAPLAMKDLKLIENLIPSINEIDLTLLKWEEYKSQGFIEYYDIESLYTSHLENYFNIPSYNTYSNKIILNALYSCCQNTLNKLFQQWKLLNNIENPLFNNKKPEPSWSNIKQEITFEKSNDSITVLFSGDSKQIAILTESGEYLNFYTIFLLLLLYTVKYKNLKGSLLVESIYLEKIKNLAAYLAIDIETISPGANDFADLFIQKSALLGLNKNGEIFIHSHVPQSDGIWIFLTILEFLKKTGKTLDQLKSEVYSITGDFVFEAVKMDVFRELRNINVLDCNEKNKKPFVECKIFENEGFPYYALTLGNGEYLTIFPEQMGFQLSLLSVQLSLDQVVHKIKEIEELIINYKQSDK